MEGANHGYNCCAPDCVNGSQLTNNEVACFKLPMHDPERCIIWIENMKRDDLLTKSREELESAGTVLCIKHFDHSQFLMPQSHVSGLILKEDAIPTLFAPQRSKTKAVCTYMVTVSKKTATEQNISSSSLIAKKIQQTVGPAVTVKIKKAFATKTKNKISSWEESCIRQAMKAVRNKSMSIREAAKSYDVKRWTLTRYLRRFDVHDKTDASKISSDGSSEVENNPTPCETSAMNNESDKSITIDDPPNDICMRDSPAMTRFLKRENEYMLRDIAWYLKRQKRLSDKLNGMVSKLDKLRNDPRYLVDFEFWDQVLQNSDNGNKHEELELDFSRALSLIETLKKEYQSRLDVAEYSMMEQDNAVTIDQYGNTLAVKQSWYGQMDNKSSCRTDKAEITASTFLTRKLDPCPVSLHFRLDRSKFHFLSDMPVIPKARRKCLVCQEITPKVPGKFWRAKLSWHKCNVCQVPLCLEPCFYLFHTTLNYATAVNDYHRGFVSLPTPSNDTHPSLMNYYRSTIEVSQEEQNTSTVVDNEDNSFSSEDNQSPSLLDPSTGQSGPSDVHRNDLSTNVNEHTGKRNNDNSNDNESSMAAHMIKKKYVNERMQRQYLLSLPSGQTECICEKCGKVITGKQAGAKIKLHMKSHNPQIIECKICGQKLRGLRYVKPHMERHAKGLRTCKCTICGFVVKHRANMKRHLRTHTKIKPFMCEICGRSFRHKISLQQHVQNHYKGGVFRAEIYHRGGRKVPGDTESKYLGIPQVKCLVCDESHCFSIDLIKHLKTHEGNEVDDGSGTKTSMEELVNRHIGRYEQELPFTCEFCVNMYSTLPFLQEHVNVSHRSKNKVCTGEKDFKKLGKYLEGRHKRIFCATCGLSTCKAVYKGHMRVHSGERPFKCSLCPKTFSHFTPFRTHMWSHKGFRPFKCQYCTKEFSQKLDFVNHLKKIHGIEYKKGDKSHERATIAPKVVMPT